MMFANWCVLRGVQAIPAKPANVADFVSDCAPLGIEEVWSAVCQISRAHCLIGLADPTACGVVASAFSDIAKIAPPRSWPKEHGARFLSLPYDVQKFLAEYTKRQDAVVRAAMQEAADARKAANLPKLPKNFYRDKAKATHGK